MTMRASSGVSAWSDGVTGDFGTAADWSTGAVPGAADDAMISGTGQETVTVSTNETVDALTLDDANATLTVTGAATLSVGGGLTATAVAAIDVTAYGTLSLVHGVSQKVQAIA